MWLVAQATGDLADAIRRDLFSDGRDFDELGWRGLWAYITTAPPGTAIYHKVSKGWTRGHKIGAEILNDLRVYIAAHFADVEVPEPIDYPGRIPEDVATAKNWQTVTLDEMVSPKVRELLRGA